MKGIYIISGSNMGDRYSNLMQAIQLISSSGEVKIFRKSAVYESAPWGIENQPNFLNQVLELQTHLEPIKLLDLLLRAEEEMGRIRTVKYGPRKIDLDLLYYRNQITDGDNLVLPHPRIAERLFVLIPLSELAADETHPVLNKTQQELLEACPDNLKIEVYQPVIESPE